MQALFSRRAATDSRKVLVVDGTTDQLSFSVEYLKRREWHPLAATNAFEAIKLLVDNPDCRRVVTDFDAPGLGGEQWIAFLERFCAGFTVVVVGSCDVDSGRFICMPKPVDFGNLVMVFERGR